MTMGPFPWTDADCPPRTVHEVFDSAIRSWGRSKVAYHFVDEGLRLTLEELGGRAEVWARALWAGGVRSGDRVAVCLPGNSRWPIVQLACSRIGAVLVGVNTRYKASELEPLMASAAPAVILAPVLWRGIPFASMLDSVLARPDVARPRCVAIDTDSFPGFDSEEQFLCGAERVEAARIAEASAEVQPHDRALIQFTSGSTSAPKGAVLSHDAVVRTAFHITKAAGYDQADLVYSALPFYHIGGSICTGAGALTSGATMVIPEAFDGEASVRHIAELGCTGEQGHPAMFAMQIEAARDLELPPSWSPLRKGWVAASGAVVTRIRTELGISELVPVYGMSEYGLISTCITSDPVEKRQSTVGRPPPGTLVRLGSDDQARGEIQVRGTGAMMGYLEEGEEEAITPDGWVRTGDLGSWDEDGYLLFVGREKDMIKPGGENVSALEVEAFLTAHPGILHAAVFGIADQRLGQVPAAVVQLRPGHDLSEDEILQHCRDHMAGFKRPRRVQIVDAVPLLPNGKVDKRSVREAFGT